YRFQPRFARTQTTADALTARDLTLLGRRLYAAFERKAGKGEFINPGIAPDLAEDTLTLVHSPDKRAPGKHQRALFIG
ncbi:class I adenylate cyclase, partial [Pseudomonas syringae pv. tagetis]|uniref:class I adenylate cyclase n=1 Tax=Pseudomonas syringae group genomosp. 7 TaxID=251699 RepID=UPI0037700B68